MGALKIGIFGLFRGMAYVREFSARKDTVVHAVYDKDQSAEEEALSICPNAIACHSFDELLQSGIQAIYLANYFPEHAKYAIQAMEAGIDVLSECTSAATMRDCVLLWEAVERTGRKYMLAENEPYRKENLEMARIYQEGSLGQLLYAEAEYNHYTSKADMQYAKLVNRDVFHWRNFLPKTYYLTHCLGPLMYVSGEWPINVCAFAVKSHYPRPDHPIDIIGMMNCMTDKGSLYRFSGCSGIVGGYGFRFVGDNGLVETGRALGRNVSVIYKDTKIPEGMHEKQVYQAEWPECGETVRETVHGGADWWVAKEFADYVLRDKYPFFDYKCGIVMSIVAILAWRSVLNHNKVYEIPDFTKKEIRDLYREDTASPFPDEKGNASMAYTSFQIQEGQCEQEIQYNA